MYEQSAYLELAASHLAGNLVQGLLSSTSDLATTLAALLGDLQVIQSQHGISDDTTGCILVDLVLGSSSVSTSESLLKSTHAGSLSEVDLSGDAGCERANNTNCENTTQQNTQAMSN